MKQRQDNLPDIPSQVHQRTWLALENMTDYAEFQQLSDEVLTAHLGYKIHPRGISARGTVKGQPDSWGHDDKGKLSAFEYGTSPDWHRKLEDDLEQVARIEGFKPEVFVFCTNRFVSADAERECAAMVQSIYGWELRLFGQGDLAVPLNTTCQYLRKIYLGIDVERHNWTSLLAACKDQRCRILKQYSEKYDPSLYVQRDAEQKIDSWYRQVKMSRRQGRHPEEEKRKTGSQLFVMVDQAGVGKTNVVLHLAEKYGKVAPVIVIPGNRTIIDEYTLEREIVHAVGYPVDGVIRARVYELCQIAQHEGSPLLVIVEGVDENRDLIGIRKAMKELLTAFQDYPLLLLITCRDTIWPFIQSSTLKGFITEGGVLPLSLYTDEEFEQARKKYFTHWNVHVELSVEAKNGLRSPLLLSIFAEVNQDCSFKFVSSVVAKDLWGKYLEKKIDAIHEALEMGKSKKAIRTAVEQIALRMLERNSPSLFYSDVSDLNRHIDPDDTSTHSLFLQLKNAAVLFEETPETVSFVYETFFEYVAGQALARAFEISTERERVLERIEELTRTYRWRQIPLYCVELVSEPDAIIERLRKPNIWLAAQAFRRTTSRTSPEVRQQLIVDLEEKLSSKFSLDRQRVADFLGLLGSSKSKDKLLHCWCTYTSNVHETQATLCALARLGVEDIVEPFIRHLGGFLEWYIPDDQELVDTLPERFRCQLLEKALALLQDPVQMGSLHDAAAHTIGYLKAEQAITPLLSYLKATEWCRWVAMLALIRIGTQEAFTALEIALGEIGERISTSDRQLSKAKDSMDDQKEDRQIRDELVIALSIVRTHSFYHSSLHVIVPFLARLLEHPNMYVRHEAIQSLGELGAYETALAITRSRSPDALIPGFGIAETLTVFGSHIDIEPILALVNDPTTPEMVVRDAIKALGVSRDKRVLEPLSVFIAQGRFLFEVIQALRDSGLHEAIPLLVRVLEDDSMDDSTESSLSRANLEYFAVENLGKLQHHDAFAPIELYARKHLPTVGHMTLRDSRIINYPE
jgi:HEAT repeat protein